MGRAVQKAARVWLGAMCLVSLNACGESLGECNNTVLGGDPATGMPYAGQAIVGTRCAGGRCHSESAMGELRVGAPADLNFDVLGGATPEEMAKVTRHSGLVVDWAEDMWSEIEGGEMPPAKPAGSGELSSGDKETVRNWLACGAPVIQAVGGTATATWDSIWGTLGPLCVSCHNAEGSMGFQGALLGELGDACGSHANIVGHVSDTMECSGQTLVVPGNPGASQLLLKLRADPAMCGMAMPYGFANGLVGTPNEAVLGLIETWIMNGALPPAGCP